MGNHRRLDVVKCKNCGADFHPNYSSKALFCTQKCQKDFEYKEYIRRWKNGEEDGIMAKWDVSNYIRRYLFEVHNSSCQLCGWNSINKFTGKVPLQIHHIDGNCMNNSENNLQLLCPNCHSLTETFGGRNRGSSKRIR